jgi:serine protease Do
MKTIGTLAVLLTLVGCGPGDDQGAAGEALAQVAMETPSETVTADLPEPRAEPETQPPALGPATQSIEASRTTAIVRAAEAVAPAVVSVNVLREQQVRSSGFFDDFFFGPSRSRQSRGFGSGIIYHDDGYVLTNDHVIRSASRIRVTLPDGRDFEAELVGSDGVTDVAVLKIDGRNLPVARLGTSRGLLIGEWTVAIGNPFAYLLSNSEPTVTAGVVSAVGRHIIPSDEDEGFYLGMIQTDASINPGNSGGPLVNALGEVIGVNTSIFSRSGGSEGLGFAIPIDRALRVADDLVQYGEVRRAWTGVDVEGADTVWGRPRGVEVLSVFPGSPAAEAGISVGDQLVEVNGTTMGSPLDLEAVLLDLRAGEEVTMVVEGRSRPYRLAAATLPTTRAERVEILEDLEVVTVTPEISAERGLEVDYGALITGITQDRTQSLDLRRGDVIVQINNRAIRTAEDAAEAIRNFRPGSQVLFRWVRGRSVVTRYFYIPG